jgi:hypothetical protein
VVVGDVLDVGVPVAVPLPVDVPLVLIVEDLEIKSVPLCGLDKLALRVGDDDGVFNMLAEILIVPDNVAIAVGESEPVPTLDGDVDGEGTALDVILALPPREIVDGGVSDGDDVLLGVIKGVDSGVGNPLSLPEGIEVGEGTTLDVILALPPKEIVGSGVADDVDARLSVIEGVDRGVDEPLSVEEGLSLPDGEVEVVGTALDVILALPPKETVDGGVSDDEDVRLCVGRGVGVIVNVSELVIAAETLELAIGVTVLEPVDESEPVSALDDEVVSVAEKLFDGVCEDEGVCVNDGIISDDVGVIVTELVSEDDKLEEIDAVTLGETVLLGVEVVDAPRVTEVVGVFDTEELKLCVDDDDGVNVPVFELELVSVTLGESVINGVGVPDKLFEGVFDTAPVCEGVAVTGLVADELIVDDGLTVMVVELETVPEGDCDKL